MSAFDVVMSGAQIGMSALQGAQQRKAQMQAAQSQAQAQTEALNRNQADAVAERDKRLSRALAARRAGLAGAGISADGSGAAILASMTSDSADEAAREAARFNAARADVQLGLASRQKLSLLDRNASYWNTTGQAYKWGRTNNLLK